MEALGDGARREVLFPDYFRAQATRHRKRQLVAPGWSGSADLRRGRAMRRLLNWFRRRQMESSLDGELRYHLERRIHDFEQSGLPTEEARRQALVELGGLARIQEEVRDVWLTRWLRDIACDLRFAVRTFRKAPSFTVTAVLSLMLGIGATTAIYSLVDQVLLHALPVRQPERLVLI